MTEREGGCNDRVWVSLPAWGIAEFLEAVRSLAPTQHADATDGRP